MSRVEKLVNQIIHSQNFSHDREGFFSTQSLFYCVIIVTHLMVTMMTHKGATKTCQPIKLYTSFSLRIILSLLSLNENSSDIYICDRRSRLQILWKNSVWARSMDWSKKHDKLYHASKTLARQSIFIYHSLLLLSLSPS